MEILQLRYFHDVAQTQHMTRSAQRLNVAQPGLSQAIRRLEAELGVKLFERVGRNIKLTECGAALDEHAAAILNEVDAIPLDMERIVKRQNARVRIAVDAASALTVDAIASYRMANPQSLFSISQAGKPGHWDVRVRSEVALDVLGEPNAKVARHTASGIEARRYPERIGVAVPAAEAEPGPVGLHRLQGEPFVSLGAKALRAQCDALCAQAGFAPNVTFESDSPATVRRVVGMGLGVAFWPEHSWEDVGEGARWEPIDDARFARTIVIERTRGPISKEAATFHGFLTDYFDKAFSNAIGHDGKVAS